MKTKRGVFGVARAAGLAAAVVMLVGGVAPAQFPHPLRLDELDGEIGVRFQGVAQEDGTPQYAGRTLAGIGDVNGDGYEDFAIGAAGDATEVDSQGSVYNGRVFVIYGRPGGWPATFPLQELDGTVGFIVEGPTPAAYFALRTLSGIGDFNGDGYSDFMVDALGGWLCPPNDPASVYLIFGRPDFPAVLDPHTLDGTNGFRLQNVECGYGDGRLTGGAGIGDVNGDGFDDIAVTFDNESYGSTYPVGEIIYGRSGSWSPVMKIADLGPGEHTGLENSVDNGEVYRANYSFYAASDLDGDGIDDFLLGLPIARFANEAVGAVYVLFGKGTGYGEELDLSLLNGTDGYLLWGGGAESERRFFGEAATSADIDGDGVLELALGAPGATASSLRSVGKTFIVSAGKKSFGEYEVETLGSDSLFDFIGVDSGDGSGGSVLFTYLDGSGIPGISIHAGGAALNNDPLLSTAGEISVLTKEVILQGSSFSLSDLDGVNGQLVQGFERESFLGWLSGGFDFNGDDAREIMCSASKVNAFRGEAYLLFGGNVVPSATFKSYIAPGNASRRAVGMMGGMHSSIPLSRLWIDFGSGDDGSGGASLMTVTINRHLDGLSNLPGPAASVHWIGEWDRPGWDGANVTLKYLDSEVAGLNPVRLRLYYSEAPDGPWTESQHPLIDTRKKRIGGVVWSKGYYVLIEKPLANGDVNKDGGVTPADAEDAFDCSIGACPPGADMDSADICPAGGDGFVTAGDAQGIFRAYLGMEPCL